jgi:S1-C subfamily serine protease
MTRSLPRWRAMALSLVLAFGCHGARSAATDAGRAWIGIDIITVPARRIDLATSASGVYVLAVHEGSPASAAGLERGDTIIEIDGRPVATADRLICAVMMRVPGSVIRLGVIRDGGTRAMAIALGRQPHDVFLSAGQCEEAVAVLQH